MSLGRNLLIWISCLGLAACGTSNRSLETSSVPNPVYKVGKPYKVAGKVYYPEINPHYDRVGLASWYGPQFHGRKTANGDVFNMNDLTAAHTTLPMPSYVRVTNLDNNRWLILKINDRGPFVGDRVIDVSRRAAQLLGFEKKGVTKVRVQAVDGPRGQLPPQTMAQVNKPTTQTVAPAKQNPQPPSQTANVQIEKLPAITTQNAEVSQDKKYYIQIGAYADPKNAKKVVSNVDHISKSQIDQVDINGQNLYRVRMGPHSTVEIAEILLGRILSLGHNTARIIMDK